MTSYELNWDINMLGISRKKLKLLNAVYIFVDTFTFTSFNITTSYFIFIFIFLADFPAFIFGRLKTLICSEIKKKKFSNLIRGDTHLT